ncbi:Ribosome biogenesis protein nsa1 (NOP7-associated protein 1) [Tieghemiomyces parasiticus]|uniref:Ribosome biogenesis protein NSA1 n=1 Tax=Tieghemiomyces parasiticus TaxID=78921 RepID=A0A9W8DN20_9FUNG|nr:Ribosome biogenesis protein nsa1 (NOP7-associated protein 1) [Tieghemiomyces parasiticus]
MANRLRCLTADESGLLKAVTFDLDARLDTETDKQIALTQRHLEAGISSQTANDESAPTVKAWDLRVNRDRAVQRVYYPTGADTVDPAGPAMMMVARQNGDVEIVDARWANDQETARPVCYRYHADVFDANAALRAKRILTYQKFVGAWADASAFAYGTNLGNFHLRRLATGTFRDRVPDDSEDTAAATTDLRVQFDTDLERLRIHDRSPQTLAYAGKERQLTLWDLTKLSGAGAQPDGSEAWAPPAGEPLFQAENVEDDWLGLRVPYHVTDFQFMGEAATRVAACTEDARVLLYDTQAGRRPTVDFALGEEPLRHIVVSPDQRHVYASDNRGAIRCYDIRAGKQTVSLRGCTGAVTDMVISPQYPNRLVSVSLDRRLRVHNLSRPGCPLSHATYLKQRMTQVVVDEAFARTLVSAATAKQTVDKDDKLWSKMAVVEEAKPAKRTKLVK